METLQRIYGISFPDPKMLKEWEKFQEEAKNRDHRKLGRVGMTRGHFLKWIQGGLKCFLVAHRTSFIMFSCQISLTDDRLKKKKKYRIFRLPL